MLESEAMAILVGAGVSYGRREAALRAAGSALAILAEPGLYAAQLQEKGLALLRHALADEARLLGGLAKKKMALVLREDAQYPPLLRQIAHPPHLLYVYGETDLTDRFPVAVVGTRRASAYGLTHTREIAAELAQTGVCVVSGLALGIDAAAHTGALDGGGRTVAVRAGNAAEPIQLFAAQPHHRGHVSGYAGHGGAAAQRRAEYRDADAGKRARGVRPARQCGQPRRAAAQHAHQ